MRLLIFILFFSLQASCQKVIINGSGNRLGINSGGTRVTITGTEAPPYEEYNDPQSGNITFTDANFEDGVPGVAKTGFTMRNPAAFVEFRTTETDFSVKVGGNWSGNGEQSKVYLLVDDVYNQSITLTANNTTQTIAITTLPAGLKNIKLVNGYAAQSAPDENINLANAGTYVQGVVTTGNIEIKVPPTPSKRIVVDGMSITTGASGTMPVLTGWAEKFKWLDGYRMTFVSYGAKALATNSGVFGSTQANAMVAYHGSLFDGTTNEMWMDLHTNDFGLSGWQFSKATYKAHVELYVNAFHTAYPTVKLIWWAPLERSNYNTANPNGATLGDYLDALNEVAADGRSSWMKVVGARTDVSSGNLSDGLHPTQSGMDEIYTNRKTAYLSITW